MVRVPARLTGVVERMERPDISPPELGDALADLARINQTFGGTRAVLDHLEALIHDAPLPVRILDVGTGYADIPRAIVRRAREAGLPVLIDALDRHDGVCGAAAHACVGYPEIRLREGDALALPYPDQSVDVALASQLLHQMENGDSVRLLRELRRVARHGVLVGDLRRGMWPHFVTWSALRIVSRSPVIRYDGPLSIRRGFVPSELHELARLAGWKAPQVSRRAFFRLVLTERID